ncbi:MAG TPA: PadR family transcriptional regulator [Candidatus Eisenbacteria bacterium]|jgi:DNA-binding PadR family transcriptional regulator
MSELARSTRKRAGAPQELDREFTTALWKAHVLHHAASGPVYGLWLLQELAEHGYRPSPGTLYPLLARMERHGLLRSRAAARAKARRSYEITPAGGRVLKALREKIAELHREVVVQGGAAARRRSTG